MEAAAKKLKTREDGGTSDGNQIILMQDYDYGNTTDFLKEHAVPVTIKGITADIKFFSTAEGTDSEFHLYEDIAFDSTDH